MSLQLRLLLAGTTILAIVLAGSHYWAYKAGENHAEKVHAQSQKAAITKSISSRERVEKRVRSMDEKAVDDQLFASGWMRDER